MRQPCSYSINDSTLIMFKKPSQVVFNSELSCCVVKV